MVNTEIVNTLYWSAFTLSDTPCKSLAAPLAGRGELQAELLCDGVGDGVFLELRRKSQTANIDFPRATERSGAWGCVVLHRADEYFSSYRAILEGGGRIFLELRCDFHVGFC